MAKSPTSATAVVRGHDAGKPNQGSRDRPDSTDLASAFGLLIFTVTLLWPLVRGRSLYWGDIMLYFEPMQRFASAELRSGRIPLWNPYLLCGQPFLGNPQMGVFYPLTLLAPFVSASRFISISTVLHMFLCGLFMYVYLRRWVVWRLSALCASIVYMGSTCLVARIQFPPMIVSACYCPLILALVDSCLERFTLSRWLGLAVSVGLLALSAHPQMAYFTLLIGAVYALCRVSFSRSWVGTGSSECSPGDDPLSRRSMRTMCKLAGAVCMGVAFAAAQLVPMLELMRVSTRERMTPGLANRFVFDLSHLATFILPNAFGSPAHADYFGGGTAWEPGIFIGWLPLAAIVYAVVSCYRSGRVRFWFLAAGLSMWLSTGTAGGIFWLAFYVVPGLSNFHDPARFLFITTVSMSVLTCIGLEAWQQRRGAIRGWGQRSVAILAIAVPLIWYGEQWNPTTAMSLNQSPLHRHVAMNGRSYLPAHDLYWRRFVTQGYADFGQESNLSVVLNSDTPNVQMREGIETAAGYEPVPVSGPAEVDGLSRIALRRDEPSLSALLRLMDVTDVELPDYRILYNADFTDIGSPKRLHSDVSMEDVDSPTHRAWLVPAAIHIEGKTRIDSAIAGPDFDPETTAIVSGMTSSQRLAVPEHPASRPRRMNEVRVESRTNTAVTLSLDAGNTPAFLVYSGTCYPGWKATIDGRATNLYCTNGAFLGMDIPGGKHRVQLFYSPGAFRLGLFIFALAFMSAAAITTFCLIARIGATIGARDGAANSRIQADPS